MRIVAGMVRAAFGVLVVVTAHGVVAAPAVSNSHIPVPWLTGEPQGVRAPAAQLSEGIAGTVLWSRDPNAQLPMASLTKVMTAVVVIQSGDLERPVTVPQAASDYCRANDGSTADLAPGEVLTARQLLYGLLLPSGCDAAYTLAEAFGPGQGGFLARMNDTARRMRLAGTYFADPSGLPVPDDYSTYSTAADLVVLGMRAMTLPVFREIVGAPTHHVPAGPGNREHFWETTNLLIGSYPGAIGIKTGYTDAAGTCLLFAAVRAGIPLVGVVLHSAQYSEAAARDDAVRMLNWGYGPIPAALPVG